MNEIIHSIPSNIKTGSGLWAYFKGRTFGKFVEPGSTVRIFHFAGDNYELVPSEKCRTHKKRKSSHAVSSFLSTAELGSIEITDGQIPDPSVIRANSVLLYKAIVYLFSKLCDFRCLFGDNMQIYLSYPSPKDMCEGLTWPAGHTSFGENVCITGGPAPPLHWSQGEGEIVLHLAASWFRATYPDIRRIVASSCDNDNYGITLLRPLAESEGLYIHLSDTVKPGTGTVMLTRILDCHALASHFASAAVRASIALVAILCGTDYCDGYDRVGPGTLIKQAFPVVGAVQRKKTVVKKPVPKITSILDEPLFDDTLECIPERAQRFIAGLFKRAEKAPKDLDECEVFQSALWNVRYWVSY